MKGEAERKIIELGRNPNYVFRLVRKMEVESTDVVGGRCMQGNNGTRYLNVNDRAKFQKAHMSEILNEKNELDEIADTDSVEGSIERMLREDIMEAFKYLTIGQASGPTEAYAEMVLASGDI